MRTGRNRSSKGAAAQSMGHRNKQKPERELFLRLLSRGKPEYRMAMLATSASQETCAAGQLKNNGDPSASSSPSSQLSIIGVLTVYPRGFPTGWRCRGQRSGCALSGAEGEGYGWHVCVFPPSRFLQVCFAFFSPSSPHQVSPVGLSTSWLPCNAGVFEKEARAASGSGL